MISRAALGAAPFAARFAPRVAPRVVSLALSLAATLLACTPSGGTGIDWTDDHDEGLALAKSSVRPVMIEFTADWCVPCQELEKSTYPHPLVRKQAERFVNIRVDASEMTEETNLLFKRYAVFGLPTIVFIDSAGAQHAERVTGFVSPEKFSLIMNAVR